MRWAQAAIVRVQFGSTIYAQPVGQMRQIDDETLLVDGDLVVPGRARRGDPGAVSVIASGPVAVHDRPDGEIRDTDLGHHARLLAISPVQSQPPDRQRIAEGARRQVDVEREVEFGHRWRLAGPVQPWARPGVRVSDRPRSVNDESLWIGQPAGAAGRVAQHRIGGAETVPPTTTRYPLARRPRSVMTIRTVSSRRPSSEDQVRSLAGPKAALTLRTVLGTRGILRGEQFDPAESRAVRRVGERGAGM